MAATGHALLGPSGSHRWMNCTPSARLEEHCEDKCSDFAEEGSCAHALCEEKLHRLLGNEDAASSAYYEQITCNRDKWYCTEMESCTDEYVSIVWNKYQEALKTTSDALLFIERQLSFEQWIPQSFGTADAIIIADGLMEVIDFKYGRGVEVSAVENTQMMIYALGAIAEFEDMYNIRDCRMTIIQPRMANTSEYEQSVEDLTEWSKKVLMPAAALAWKGKGEQKAGEWCRFCKIKATCSKLANQALAAYTQHEVKELINDADYPKILSLIPAIKAWCSAVEDYATAKAIDGTTYDGFKLVEGRSVRVITDKPEMEQRFKSRGYTEEQYMKPLELKTITELEKLVGKKNFAESFSDLVEKPKGKPTLVPNSDKRQPISVNTAEEAFKDILN